jgi:hypothetical protein
VLGYINSLSVVHVKDLEKMKLDNETLKKYTSVLYPNLCGIHPEFLDPRVSAGTLNRIRVIAQATTDEELLASMGIAPQRRIEIISGSPFFAYEIKQNLAYTQFLST